MEVNIFCRHMATAVTNENSFHKDQSRALCDTMKCDFVTSTTIFNDDE